MKDPEQRKKHEEYLVHNKQLLDIIIGISEDKIQKSVNDMRTTEAYKMPRWEYYQADQLGYQRALSELVKILNLDRG
jgi:hypothetical protein